MTKTSLACAFLLTTLSSCAPKTDGAPPARGPAIEAPPAEVPPALASPPSPAEPPPLAEEPAPSAAEPSPPPPSRPGPCPAPSPERMRLYARAAGLAETTGAVEPHHAIVEAVRMRLDEIYVSGCRPSLSDAKLVEEVKRIADGLPDPPKLFAHSLGPLSVMVGQHTSQSSVVAMYTWVSGKVRTRVEVTDEGLTEEQRLLLLDTSLFQPPELTEPLLVVANTHPWMASCWRSLRFRVLAPSGDPRAPRSLLDVKTSGRWCEEVTIQTSGSDLSFHYDTWVGVLTQGGIQKPHVLAFHYAEGRIDERFGFAPGFDWLVEDWLMRPWSLAREATREDARARLQPLHDELSAVVDKIEKAASERDSPQLTHELFPAGDPSKRRFVLYCKLSESDRPCPNWAKPVDFSLENRGGHWIVSDVKRRP